MGGARVQTARYEGLGGPRSRMGRTDRSGLERKAGNDVRGCTRLIRLIAVCRRVRFAFATYCPLAPEAPFRSAAGAAACGAASADGKASGAGASLSDSERSAKGWSPGAMSPPPPPVRAQNASGNMERQ